MIGADQLAEFLSFLGQGPVYPFLGGFLIGAALDDRYGADFIAGAFGRSRQDKVFHAFFLILDSVMQER